MMQTNLMQNTQQQQQQQRGGIQRTKQPPAGAITCCIHNKTRGPNNVEPTYAGSQQYRCKAGSECKLPDPQSGVNQMKDSSMPTGNVTCAIHHKNRGANNVELMFPGSNQYRCKPGSECKIPAALPKNEKGTVPPGSVVCCIHHKTRGPNNVEQVPGTNPPQWRCRPGSECKLPANLDANQSGPLIPGQPAPIHPTEPQICWAHGKKRSANQLHQVNTPFGAQWECMPQFKCKGASGTPAPQTTMPTAAAAAAAASGGPYPVPLGGMDPATNAYLQHAMLMQQSMGLGQLSGV